MTKLWEIFKIAALLSVNKIPKNQQNLTSQIIKEVRKYSTVLGHNEKKNLEHQSINKVGLLNQQFNWKQTRTFGNWSWWNKKVEEESKLKTDSKDYLITKRGQNELHLIGKGFMPIIGNEIEFFLVEKNEENLLLIKENKYEVIEERKEICLSYLEGNDKQRFDFVVSKYLEAGAISVPFHLGRQGKKYAAQFLLEKIKIQSINNELYPKD